MTRDCIVKITEYCGAIFIAPIDQITDPDNPEFKGLQFTSQGTEQVTLSSVRDLMIKLKWLREDIGMV